MKRVNNEKPEEFLLKYGKAIQDKKDSIRVENLRKETEGLSFKPKVSKVSEMIVNHRKGSIGGDSNKYSKFDSLYQDAQRRHERQQFIYSACIEAECTF